MRLPEPRYVIANAHRRRGRREVSGGIARRGACYSRPRVCRGHCPGQKYAQPGIVRWHPDRCRNPLRLAEPFVIAEDESLVLDDGSARRAAKLVATERRPGKELAWIELVGRGLGEVIIRVEHPVPKELVEDRKSVV